MRFQPFLTALVAAILGIMTETDLRAGDEPSDKPRGLAFEEWLKTKEGSVNGVLIRLTKTESVETDPKVSDRVVILKLNWSINYDGKRWPLVILEPSLANETSGQTCVHVVAIGRSGKEYRSLIDSPTIDWWERVTFRKARMN
ncbi:MAG: hypothetical protein EXS09_20330 [Gemmataceae bacterium]|nr:hypothetical protein [Gemmataceae bacterium]